MKHLNANLDSITNVETNKTPNGAVRAIGVDSVNDIVAIPGIEHGSGGSTTFTTECQFIRASEIATRTDLGTGVRSTRITFAESLENLVEAGGTISFYAGSDLDLTDDTVNDGAVAVVSVTVLAVATTTIDIEPITGSVDDLTTLLTSTATLIPTGETEAQGVFFTDCIDVTVTVEGPAGGNLCVTGNILLGGQLTDKDGNPVVEMSPDGDIILGDSDGDGDIIVEGDVVGPETECTPLVDPLNTDNALRITSIEPSTIITGQPIVIKTTVPTAEFLNSIDYLEQGSEITLDCGDGKLFSATIDRTEQVTTFSDGSDEIINVMDTLLFDADLTAADCITHAATLTNLTYTTTATPSRFANLFVIPSEIANLIGTNPVAGTTALLDAPGGGDFANSRQGTVIDNWPADITVPTMNSCSGGVAYLQGGGNAANEQFRFIVPNNTALGANNLHDITVANIDAIFGTTVAAQNFDYTANGIGISQLTLRYPTDNNAANDLIISFDSTAGLQILKYYGADIFQYGTWYSFGFNNAGFTYVQGPSATNTQGQAISAFETDLGATGVDGIWVQPAASLANYLAESVRAAANWSWSSTDPNLNINFPNNAGSCNVGGALPWPYGNDLVIRLDENNTTLNYNCAAGDLRFYNTVTTITPSVDPVLLSDNFCIYTIGTEAQTVFDISPEDFQNCSLTCSDGEEEVIIGGDIIVEGDEDVEGDLNVEGDVIVNGGGGDCMDVIEGITPQGFTETTDDFIFSFAPAVGTGAALLAAELRRQLAAGDIEFRYQAAQTVTQQGQTSLLTSAGTYTAVPSTSDTTLTLTGVNAAIVLEITASIASDTANNTALTFLEINGLAFGIQSIAEGGVAETADILLVDGQNLLASATGDFVNLVYVGSIVTTEVIAALLVPQNSPATAVADAGGSGMPFRVTITVPKIFYGNITAPILNTVLVDSFGLVNCPALTAGGNVLVVGDLIITSDGDGDGGDVIIEGDVVIDGDIDTDGDITSEGDIMAADVSCTGGASVTLTDSSIFTNVFLDSVRDRGEIVPNVVITITIQHELLTLLAVDDMIGIKNTDSNGVISSSFLTITEKDATNPQIATLRRRSVGALTDPRVGTNVIYSGGTCTIANTIVAEEIIVDDIDADDIVVGGMICVGGERRDVVLAAGDVSDIVDLDFVVVFFAIGLLAQAIRQTVGRDVVEGDVIMISNLTNDKLGRYAVSAVEGNDQNFFIMSWNSGDLVEADFANGQAIQVLANATCISLGDLNVPDVMVDDTLCVGANNISDTLAVGDITAPVTDTVRYQGNLVSNVLTSFSYTSETLTAPGAPPTQGGTAGPALVVVGDRIVFVENTTNTSGTYEITGISGSVISLTRSSGSLSTIVVGSAIDLYFGGSCSVGGDMVVDGDLDIDGDVIVDGDVVADDVMADDVSCTGGMSLASPGNAIQTSVFAARDIGGVVTSNVLISGIIVNPIYATVNVGDVIGLKNVTADGSTTSGVYTVTAKANANSVAFSLTSNGVTGIDSTSVVTTYFGGSCAIGPVITVGDIISDGDISVDGMLCQDVGATVFGPITKTIPGTIGTVVIDGVRLLSDFSAVVSPAPDEYAAIGSPAIGDHVILSDGDNRSVFRYDRFNPNQGGRHIFERVSGNVEQPPSDRDISRIDITPCGLTVVDGDIVTDGDIIADDIILTGDLTVDRTICQSPGAVSSDLLPSAATRVITSEINSVRILEEFDLTPSEFTTFGSPTVGAYYILEGSAAVSIGEGVYEYERALLTGTTITGHRFVRVNGNLQHTQNSLDLSGLNATPCGFTIMDGDIITDGDIVADIIVSTGDLTVSGMICNGGTFVRRTISGIDGDTPADLIVGSELEYDGSLIFFNVAGRFRDSLFALLGTETITRGEQFTIFNQSLELSGVFEVADQPGDSQTFLNFISGDLSLAALAIGQEIVIAYAAVCVADGAAAVDSFTSAISTCNAATGGGFSVNPTLLQAEIITDGSENDGVISRLTLNQAPANTLNVLSGALNPDRVFGELVTVGTRFFFAESNSITNGGVYEVTNVVLLTPTVANNPLESMTLARVSGNYRFDRMLTSLEVTVFTNGTCLVGGEIVITGVANVRGGVARRATFDEDGVATSDVGGVNTWSGTQVQYDAITTKDDSIIYYTR